MKKGVIKDTTHRKRGNTRGVKEDKVKKDILDLLSRSEKPVSTQDIAQDLEKPWHSIQTRCLMLQIEGKVIGFRVGRINLWQFKIGEGGRE